MLLPAQGVVPCLAHLKSLFFIKSLLLFFVVLDKTLAHKYLLTKKTV